MTIEEILNCTPDVLEKMGDKELLAYFAAALQFTHVDKIVKKVDTKKTLSTVVKQKQFKVQSTVQSILALYEKSKT